jgi:5-aminolevulinate synthase
LKTSSVEREGQQRQAGRVKRVLAEAGLPVLPTETHIVPLIVGDARLCKAASDMLMDRHNIYIQPINYPTVPRGTERLRITPTPYHSDDMIAELCDALIAVWQTLDLPRDFDMSRLMETKLVAGDLTLPTVGG